MNGKYILFNIMFFLILFFIILILTYLMNLHKYKKKKYKKIGELNYLILKFRLDIKKLNVRKMLLWFSLIDAFIMSFVATFVTMLNISMMWQMVIGFVLLFGLIYACYEIYGRHVVKKIEREKKNEF